MSEQHQEHEGFIKTPKQLIAVSILAFVVPVGIAILVAQLVTSGRKGGGDAAMEKANALIQPVAKVELQAGGGAKAGARTGKEVYDGACKACHEAGVAGAPKTGDKGSWASRLGAGLEGLTKSAIAGKGGMPPRGGNPDLTDAEIARAIAFMANQSGANFKEPEAPKADAAAAAAVPCVPPSAS